MKNILKNKLMQMFILGFETPDYRQDKNFCNAFENNLGGIIFFSKNFTSVKKLKSDIKRLKNKAADSLFISIDQEGGLVERTISLDKKVNYLTQKAISRLSNADIKVHYDILCKELNYLGFNMNFAPCVDVDTNPQNPIISIRAFSKNTNDVCKNSKIVIDVMKKNNIISVAKHFPGHGDCNVDSHQTMPTVSGDFNKFYDIHIKPFKTCVDNNVDCVMIGHINCKFNNKFSNSNVPASLSKEIIDYLKKELNFKGLIISDDMVMGGVSKYFSLKQSILNGIQAGIEIFIFKNTTSELLNIIDDITEMASSDTELKNIIEKNYNKIIEFKGKKLKDNEYSDFDYNSAQNEVNKLAKKTILLQNKDKLSQFKTNKKYYILRFNPKEIYNLSFDKFSFKNVLNEFLEEEIFYSLNPTTTETENIIKQLDPTIPLIFVSYNIHQNKNQQILLNKILNKKIIISAGNEYELNCFDKKDIIFSTVSPKPSSLLSSAELLIENIRINAD